MKNQERSSVSRKITWFKKEWISYIFGLTLTEREEQFDYLRNNSFLPMCLEKLACVSAHTLSRRECGIFVSDLSSILSWRKICKFWEIQKWDCFECVNNFHIKWGQGYIMTFVCSKHFRLCGPLLHFIKKQLANNTYYIKWLLA